MNEGPETGQVASYKMETGMRIRSAERGSVPARVSTQPVSWEHSWLAAWSEWEVWALGIRRCLGELGTEVSLIYLLPCSPTHSFTHYFIPLLCTEYPHVLGGLIGLGTKKNPEPSPPSLCLHGPCYLGCTELQKPFSILLLTSPRLSFHSR